jgi:glutamyl-tRNA reductase
MEIYCISLNHQNANVALREALAYSPENARIALARLGCGHNAVPKSIRELVILSTCNRVELYAVAGYPIYDQLESFLAETRAVPRESFSSALVRMQGEQAVAHLLHVAAGLQSIVLGEPQILGQVTSALGLAREQGASGKILNRLFQMAIHAGKRAHTETQISHNPASIASVAVRLISEVIPDLAASQIVVLGAGQMAELAVESLIKRGAENVQVVNRTIERAEAMALRWHGRAKTYEHLPETLENADILITSTGAPHTLIHADMVATALKARPQRPLVIMDIAVPRDVDADVGHLEGVHLYDMDALANNLKASLAKREREIPQVEGILAEEKARFMAFWSTLDVLPIIVAVRTKADHIRAQELAKTLQNFPGLSSDSEKKLEALTKAIVKKILHNPTVRLQAEANGPDAAEYASVARNLFGTD